MLEINGKSNNVNTFTYLLASISAVFKAQWSNNVICLDIQLLSIARAYHWVQMTARYSTLVDTLAIAWQTGVTISM